MKDVAKKMMNIAREWPVIEIQDIISLAGISDSDVALCKDNEFIRKYEMTLSYLANRRTNYMKMGLIDISFHFDSHMFYCDSCRTKYNKLKDELDDNQFQKVREQTIKELEKKVEMNIKNNCIIA